MTELMDLAHDLLRLGEQRRSIDEQMNAIKDNISFILKSEETAEIVVPTSDEDYVYHIKNNLRFTKSFDKEGLAAEIARSKDDLDWHGITKLVEDGYLKSQVVAKFQSDNKSYFVSVRRKKAAGGKK
jgi:hypothetical protein